MKFRSGATIEITDWSRGKGSDSSRSSGRRKDKGDINGRNEKR